MITIFNKRFLPPFWENQLFRNVVNSKMLSSESFSTFADCVIAGNNLLEGSKFRLSIEQLRETLMSNMGEYLDSKWQNLKQAERERIKAIGIFDDWLLEIVTMDSQANDDLKRVADMAAESVAKRQRLNYDPSPYPVSSASQNVPPPTPHYPMQNKQYKPFVSGTNAVAPLSHQNRIANIEQSHIPYHIRNGNHTTGGFRPTRCPKLTDIELRLLNEHKGCRKCRKFYVPHTKNNCPNDWPDPATYCTLTLDMALAAMASAAVASVSFDFHRNKHHLYSGQRMTQKAPSSASFEFSHAPHTTNASTASGFGGFLTSPTTSYNSPAPMVLSSGIVEEPYPDRQSTIIAETPSATVSAVLPSTNFVLETSDPDSDKEVSLGPLMVPNLMWRANVWGKDPFQIPINCMIDDGTQLVLIRPETVADLGLHTRTLFKPICITLALNGENTNCLLSKYVSLQLSSLNNAWTSHPIRALIATGLCADILLGLPWLKHNSIVIDHKKCTVIDKKTNFNLFDDSTWIPRMKNIKLSPKTKRKYILHCRKQMIAELKIKTATHCERLNNNECFERVKPFDVPKAIAAAIVKLASNSRLEDLEQDIKKEFKDIFEPILHIDDLPTTETARIRLKDEYKKIAMRTYMVPRQFRESFSVLIQKRLDSGFICPSSSPYASPSFIIPKADPKALPHWVCNYRQLNENTVPDNFTLPRVDDILADCARGRIWASIDMTDSFFQTRMHEDDIWKTVVSTPLRTYEWRVMPMGFRNAPSIHQRRVTNVLRKYIGKICHIYLDDIIIWSDSVEEHITNIHLVMQALREAKLYVNKKKTKLFCYELSFLGHKISQKGVEADLTKVDKILDWPVPKNATEVRAFLGLVRYLNAFLPRLTIQSEILSRLTTKECEKDFPAWLENFQTAFDKIKQIVVSRECLTVIDHKKLETNKIFLTTDASECATGVVLSFGPTWETARPVAFDSRALRGAELNYAVHKKELLAILRTIRKWRVDLLGSPFLVYTDHKTLLNFHTQKDLSQRQARWMEELSIYDCKFVYIKGCDNSVADALSQYPCTFVKNTMLAKSSARHPYNTNNTQTHLIFSGVQHNKSLMAITAALSVSCEEPASAKTKISLSINDEFINGCRSGYETDKWC